MPVTKTAKRALRSSKRKGSVNSQIISKLERALRVAKKTKKDKDIQKAFSLADRAKKKNVMHKNKVARIKSNLIKFVSRQAGGLKGPVAKKTPRVTKSPKKK
jgi:ribosomal protein S20